MIKKFNKGEDKMGISKKEQFEKFSKDREEIKNKILEFYEPKFENEMFRMHIISNVPEQLQKDFKFSAEQVNGQPCFFMSGNKLQLFNAIFMLLNYNDDFFRNLNGVLALKELEMAEGLWYSLGAEFHPTSREETDVLREMCLKSPEELEKLRKQLENL